MAVIRDSGIVIPRNSTAYLDFVVAISGAAQNITGWSLWWTAKRRLSDLDAAAVIAKTLAGGGIVVTNAAGGVGHVKVLPADTSALGNELLDLYGDLQGRDTAGDVFQLDLFLFQIGPEVTYATS